MSSSNFARTSAGPDRMWATEPIAPFYFWLFHSALLCVPLIAIGGQSFTRGVGEPFHWGAVWCSLAFLFFTYRSCVQFSGTHIVASPERLTWHTTPWKHRSGQVAARDIQNVVVRKARGRRGATLYQLWLERTGQPPVMLTYQGGLHFNDNQTVANEILAYYQHPQSTATNPPATP